MTIESLRTVTLATIENYRKAGQQAARAYRLGGQRLLLAVNAGVEKGLGARPAQLVPQVATSVRTLQGRVSDVVGKGIEQVSQRAETAVDVGADGAVRQVGRVADLVAGVGHPVVANGLQAAARLTLPGAKVALTVSGKLAEGAEALSAVAQGAQPAKAVKKAVKSARRTVQRAAKPKTDMLRDVAAKAGAKAGTRSAARKPAAPVAAKPRASRAKRVAA